MIPNNIIHFWDDLECFPDELKKSVNITLKSNPTATFIMADDSYMVEFITKNYGKFIAKLYSLNRIPASRSDLARLMLLYEYGGFYVDVSMGIKGPLINLVDSDTEILLVQRDENSLYRECPEKAHVINGIIGAQPKSGFIQWCVRRALSNLLSEDLNTYVFASTGPRVLNQALNKFELLLQIKKLSFSKLKNDFLEIKRVDGISNKWTKMEINGIIDPDFYKENSKGFEKSWRFMSTLYSISFRSLYLKIK